MYNHHCIHSQKMRRADSTRALRRRRTITKKRIERNSSNTLSHASLHRCVIESNSKTKTAQPTSPGASHVVKDSRAPRRVTMDERQGTGDDHNDADIGDKRRKQSATSGCIHCNGGNKQQNGGNKRQNDDKATTATTDRQTDRQTDRRLQTPTKMSTSDDMR